MFNLILLKNILQSQNLKMIIIDILYFYAYFEKSIFNIVCLLPKFPILDKLNIIYPHNRSRTDLIQRCGFSSSTDRQLELDRCHQESPRHLSSLMRGRHFLA